jgi:tripartite-type tricarboxylate transporter receptor subunit TctC
LFKLMTGVSMVHVPYRGAGPALTDVLGGQVQIAITGMTGAIEHVRTGKLRALAVTTLKRLEALPDIPTVAEFVPGYEAIGWYGLGMPKNTPADVVGKVNAAMNKALATANAKARLADLGVEAMPMTPAEFTKFVGSESDKWTKVIKAAGVTLE